MNRRTFLAAAAVLAPSSILAQTAPPPVTAGSLVIERPWTRATPDGSRVAGGFMRITNRGAEPERLMGGSFPNAPRVEVHEMVTQDGVMRMREVSGGLVIPPGGTVELRPGGYHMMFMDLGQPVRRGAPLAATLQFQRAGTVNIAYEVAPVGARSPDGAAETPPAHQPRH